MSIDANIGSLSGIAPIQDDSSFENRYELLEFLGEYLSFFLHILFISGATASVRRAINRDTNDEVAVKIIPIEKLKLNKSITREVNIMKKLNHPGIVKLKDVMMTSQNLYIVMEM